MILKPLEISWALPRSSMVCQYYQHRAQKTYQRKTKVTDNEPNVMTDQNGEIPILHTVNCSVLTSLMRDYHFSHHDKRRHPLIHQGTSSDHGIKS
jgi:hypothetical protein